MHDFVLWMIASALIGVVAASAFWIWVIRVGSHAANED